MSNDGAFVVIFAVVGVGHLAMAYLTWLRRARWEANAQRWKGFMRWFTGQRMVNSGLALGVFYLGLALALA